MFSIGSHKKTMSFAVFGAQRVLRCYAGSRFAHSECSGVTRGNVLRTETQRRQLRNTAPTAPEQLTDSFADPQLQTGEPLAA